MMDQEIIFKGEIDNFELENCTSIGKCLYETVTARNEEICQINETTGVRMTYSELVQKGLKIAKNLNSKDIGAGDVILTVSGANLDFTPVMLGTWWAGAIFAPLDPSLKTMEMKHMINLIEPKVIFCVPESASAVVEAAKILQSSAEIVIINCSDKQCNGHISYYNQTLFHEYLENCPKASQDDFVPYSCKDCENTACLILCSSGTTGLPKGVMIPHSNLQKFLFTARKNNLVPDDATHIVLSTSIFWISGFFGLILSLFLTKTLAIIETVTEETLFPVIEKYKIQFIILSPAMVVTIAKSNTMHKYNTSSLKNVLQGGAPVGRSTVEEASKKIGVEILDAYGTTELSLVAGKKKGKTSENSGLSLWPNVQIKIVDPESGKSLPTNKTGEIVCKTSTLMLGYYRNQKATLEAFDADGWYHTGDIGYFNEDKELLITDRIKEVIKFRGAHVPPAELEALLLTHPAVVDVGVVGKDHEVDGHHPVAFAVLKNNEFVTEEELKKLVQDNLSQNKWLRGGVKFLKEIPRTATGKILRRKLREKI